MKIRKPVLVGVLSSIGLTAVYFITVSIFSSPREVLIQFMAVWYWVILLAAGFGIHMGLFTYTLIYMKQRKAYLSADAAASGTISTGSMIACCAHHIASLLPFLGLTAVAVFLVKFYIPLILTGILFNLAGITFILNMIQKNHFYDNESGFAVLFQWNMKIIRNTSIALLIIGVPAAFIFSAQTGSPNAKTEEKTYNLEELQDSRDALSIAVKPEKFKAGSPIRFFVAFNSHSGVLNFNMTNIAVLKDDSGNIYKPVKWEGEAPGGHHLSGFLVFPAIKSGSKSMMLSFINLFSLQERLFIWKLEK